MSDFDVQQVREAAADVLSVHRWKSMGVASVECECGEILYGNDRMTQFPADEAFRKHLADAAMAVIVPAVTAQIGTLAYASTDGTEYEHADHSRDGGSSDCPACWAEGIRRRCDQIEASVRGDDRGWSGMLRADPLERGVDHHPLAAIESQPQPDLEQDALPFGGECA